MASIVWTGTYLCLVVELILTFLLVIPVPKKIRNILARQMLQWQIYERFQKPLWFIFIGLTFGFVDCYMQWQRLLDRQSDAPNWEQQQHGVFWREKQAARRFQLERNMYLAGFALTLLFVIGRIVELMKESIVAEEQCHRFISCIANSVNTTSSPKMAEQRSKVTTTTTNPQNNNNENDNKAKEVETKTNHTDKTKEGRQKHE